MSRARRLFEMAAVGCCGVICLAVWSSAAEPASIVQLQATMEKLVPLHTRLGTPKAGEWLASHPEPGQTFAEYLRSKPVTPQGKRSVIYVQPLGDFTATQRKIVTLTADFMSRYFNRPVKVQSDLPLSVIPEKARRKHPTWGVDQILTTYVLNDVLKPRLPDDAAASIAFTASDLWPGEGWNFVFGQASLSDRVGVWSINRNGDPDKSPDDYLLCLRRTLKTATHETGHMFSLHHCTKYACDMNGSNNREEADGQPLELCPECMAKICWATKTDPAERFRKLAAFSHEQGLKTEEDFYEKSLAALTPATTGAK